MDLPLGPIGRVTVFGGVTVDRIGASAATPVLGASNPGTVRASPGGVGFNVATVLGRLGVATRLCARIGADADGELVIAAAEAAGVDVSGVGVSREMATPRYVGALDDEGGLIVGIADMNAYEEITPAVLSPLTESARDDEMWILDANLPAEAITFLAGEAESAGRPLAALSVSPSKAKRLIPILDRLTILFTNRREAVSLLGLRPEQKSASATDLARELSRPLAKSVIVTDGSAPLAVASGGETRSFAPLKAVVRSVNGAGDAFAAGVVHGLAGGRPLIDAVLDGLAAAAITLESTSVTEAPFSPSALSDRIAATRKGS